MTIRFLTSVITSLLDAAMQDGKASIDLKGLRVSVRLTPALVCLHLSRPDVYPTHQEFLDILDAWPYPVQAVPARLCDGRYFVSTSWPRPDRQGNGSAQYHPTARVAQ